MVVVKIQKTTVVTWLLRIFLLLLGSILIYQLLRKIFGGSWHEQLLLGLILANLGYSFYLGNKLSEQQGWLTQFEKRFEQFEQFRKNEHKTPPHQP